MQTQERARRTSKASKTGSRKANGGADGGNGGRIEPALSRQFYAGIAYDL